MIAGTLRHLSNNFVDLGAYPGIHNTQRLAFSESQRSNREKEVVLLVARVYRNKEIGGMFLISEQTVSACVGLLQLLTDAKPTEGALLAGNRSGI